MTITEKAAYLRGLVEGRGLDPEAGEGKLWYVLSELVGDMATELAELRRDHEELSDAVEETEVGIEYLEELLQDYDDYDDLEDFDTDDDGDDGYYPFRNDSFRIVGDDDDEEEEDEPEDDTEDRGVFYEVECPNCGEEISFDDETLDEGSIQCPNCGAKLEFDTRSPEDEEDGAPAPETETETERGEDS